MQTFSSASHRTVTKLQKRTINNADTVTTILT